jgi:hypothetical protein
MNPHLDERDAQTLARRVVEHLRKLGAHVTQFSVHLEREGFYFRATIGGSDVWVQTGQGNFTYEAVAAELFNAALHHAGEFAHPALEIVRT